MKYKCNLCGAEMLDQSKGPYILFACPKCDNAIATYDYTKDDPIKFDDEIYIVKSNGNKASFEVLKVVSKINGLNYIECKKLIENDDIICLGKATDIIESLKKFKQNSIQFKITPDFKYEI